MIKPCCTGTSGCVAALTPAIDHAAAKPTAIPETRTAPPLVTFSIRRSCREIHASERSSFGWSRAQAGPMLNSPADSRIIMSQVTLLLDASRRGESGAVEQLFDLLYHDLRQLAHAKLRRSGQFTLLDTTALVHESYLRLFKAGSIEAQDRGHFMGYAAQVMRSIVVDFVRRRSADRRGGDAVHVDIDVAAAQG
jgi:hypothetical protein